MKQQEKQPRTSSILLSITGAFLLVILASICTLFGQATYADTGNSNGNTVSVTVNSACTMKGGSDGTSTSDNIYSATIDPGTTEVINGSKLVTVCNDDNGYSIYAIGYSGNSYDSPGNTQMISSIGAGNINTNTSGDASYWAMKLSGVSGITPPTILNNFDSYHVIPENYTQIAKYTSTTESGTVTGAAVQTSYRIHINSAQVAATYTGKVKYTMVHPNTEIPPTKPMTLDAIAADTSHTHYMQDSIDCEHSTIGTKVTLTDSRDSQTYQVAKAADGQCWMIENLKLGKTITEQNPTLTLATTDSNVNSSYILQYDNIPSDGKFHPYTIDGVVKQNNSNEFICRTDWDSCYYNWFTATAGAGTSYVATGGTNVDTSICPVGWTLPRKEEFQALYDAYPLEGQMLVDNPKTTKNNSAGKIPGFLIPGYYDNIGFQNSGVITYYWSRTVAGAESAYNLRFINSNVSTNSNMVKYTGYAVRCLHN